MQATPGRVALVGGGLIFLWSGFRGASITGTLKDLITGVQPKGGVNPITGTGGGGAGANGSTPSGVANDALQYEGDPYIWGGADFPRGGDCSGLGNDVVGRDLGLAIPGFPSGKFSGHGPVTGQWFSWRGLTTVSQSDMQPGDIVCWLSHMGIAVSTTHIISALNPSLGVRETTIAGASPGAEPMRIGRLKQISSGVPRSSGRGKVPTGAP
jgi:cell wall-associated NlpC family hydrolase